MPPIDGSSVGDVIARVITKLSKSPPAPKLVAPVTDMLREVANYAPGENFKLDVWGVQMHIIVSATTPTPQPSSNLPNLTLTPHPSGWMAALLSAIGRVPGADTVMAHLMATSTAEAASLVGGDHTGD
jgi:hypothetical protein